MVLRLETGVRVGRRYRMRGIGKGQTIHLFVIPEVKLLIKKTLDAKFSGNLVQVCLPLRALSASCP